MSGTQGDDSRGATAARPAVLEGLSETELDSAVSRLRTDKNRVLTPVPAARGHLGALTEQLLLSAMAPLGPNEPAAPVKSAEGLPPPQTPEPPPPLLEPEPTTAPALEPEPDTQPEAPQATASEEARPALSTRPSPRWEVRRGTGYALGGGLVGGLLMALAMWLLGLAASPKAVAPSVAQPAPAVLPAPVAPPQEVTAPVPGPSVAPASTASTAAPVRKRERAQAPARPRPSAPQSVAPVAAREAEEDDELALDEEFARTLFDPSKRAAPPKRTVWLPPDPVPPATLSQADILAVAAANKAGVAACVSARKPSPGEGKRRVAMRWNLLPSGRVTKVATETAAYQGTPLALCLEEEIRSWKFPRHREPGGPIHFSFTF